MIDHIVYATPDLEATGAEIARDWGVHPTPGGRHTGRGTHNALLDLGEGRYLELIGPDLRQPEPAQARAFGIDSLSRPRLVTWAAKAASLRERVARSRAAGYDPGDAVPMQRETPTGDLLRWELTRRDNAPGDGLVPFLIDWGATAHPSTNSARGCRLVSLVAEHPRPDEIRRWLDALEVTLPVSEGPAPALIAHVLTPRGEKVLR